jgi:hypothetical protein
MLEIAFQGLDFKMGEHGEHAPLELYSVFVTTTE